MANIEEGKARVETINQCFASGYDTGIAPGVVVDIPEAEAEILVERGDAVKAGNKKLGPVDAPEGDPDNAAVEGADAE